MKNKNKKMKHKNGFTMTELLVAMAIMGLLIVMAFPTMRAVQTNNTNKKYESYGNSAISASKLYVDSYGDDLFDPDRVNQNGILYFTQLKNKDLIKDVGISDSTCVGESNIKIVKYNNDYTYCLHLICKIGTKVVYEKEDKRGACKNFDTTKVNYEYNGETKSIEVVQGDNSYKILSPEQLGFDVAGNHDTFHNWQIGSTPYTPGTIYNHPIDSSITFKANATKWQYKINFLKNSDGTYSGSMGQQTCTYGQNCNLTDLGFSRTGWTFKNWQKDSSTTFNNKENVKTRLGETITYDGQQFNLTAIFRKNVCTVTFNPNGGTFGNNASNVTQATEYDNYNGNDEDGMRNANGGYYKATRTGYHADQAEAWISGSKKFDETKKYLGQELCDLSAGDNSATLKVNWKVTNYTITYTLNSGSVSGNPTSYTVETDTITLKNPTRTNYTFEGWTGSNGTTKQTTVTIPKGSTGNKSYTANWKLNKPTCSIAISNSPTSSGGWYTSSVNLSMSTTGSVTSKGLATTQNSTNGATTATVSSTGTTTYYGYVSNSAGSNTCSKTVKLDVSNPTCKLSVSSGNTCSGADGRTWYTNSPVVTMSEANDTGSGVNTSTKKIQNKTGNYTVTSDGKDQTIKGTLSDNAGHSGSCTITISKDTGNPTITKLTGEYDGGWSYWYHYEFKDAVSGLYGPESKLQHTYDTSCSGYWGEQFHYDWVTGWSSCEVWEQAQNAHGSTCVWTHTCDLACHCKEDYRGWSW